ncbi:ImmA/IrrE family metallo-endopeptidase [Agreia sp. PsM10]|uniref:ImmA/IrrE family metallo-endopeptidase n=1 Tax=Agreia sp. PsM10 TaxID=3030533 RepID=UPI00263B83EA|nr:ImmA/IrrE family metallo-endopeptidase [Agreia sp. PsM10]MDN4640765.1 ImmA/IrrE family metallo-endopeptidase [Agreia sp. PsM10]
MTLKHGFKAQSERTASKFRGELGLAASDALDPRVLAEHLGVAVVDAGSLIAVEELEELERIQAYSFSAATFDISARKIIVVSPLRSRGRQNSDIAHELSHVILDHDLSEVRELAGMPFRTCKPEEEEEATALGGALLLPRDLLMSAARRNATIEQIADQYLVTSEMARYRYNTTGVAKQVSRTR